MLSAPGLKKCIELKPEITFRCSHGNLFLCVQVPVPVPQGLGAVQGAIWGFSLKFNPIVLASVLD